MTLLFFACLAFPPPTTIGSEQFPALSATRLTRTLWYPPAFATTFSSPASSSSLKIHGCKNSRCWLSTPQQPEPARKFPAPARLNIQRKVQELARTEYPRGSQRDGPQLSLNCRLSHGKGNGSSSPAYHMNGCILKMETLASASRVFPFWRETLG